jgi:hypothetical protein
MNIVTDQEQRALFWRSDIDGNCMNTPFMHGMCILYNQYGKNGIIEKCVRSEYKPCDFLLTTITRNPIEKYISNIFHNSETYNNHHIVVNQLVNNNNTLLITIDDMKKLIHSERPLAHEVLYTLSRVKHHNQLYPTQEIYDKAIINLINDFGPVGTMEYYNSYVVLLSKVYQFDIQYVCNIHITHGSDETFLKLYNQTLRPNAKELLSKDVYEYMENVIFKYDFMLWQYITTLHKKQLSNYGLTVESATELFDNICNNK